MMEFLRALRAGAVVSDPANLKRKQQMIDALVVLVGVVLSLADKAGYKLELAPDEMSTLAGAAFVLYGAVNGMLSAASTDKIGLLPAKSNDAGVDN